MEQSMHSERDLHDLIGMVYDGSTDPRGWGDFLARLAHLAGATRAAIVFNDSQCRGHGFSAQFGMDPEIQRLYLDHYASVDVWFRYKPANCNIGSVVTSQMLCPDTVLDRSEFYNDYLRRLEIFNQCGAVICQQSSATGVISMYRSRKAQPFGETQLRILRLLLPHLQRAMQLHDKFSALRDRNEMLGSALDRTPAAIVFVDARGQVILANRSAARLIDARDGLLLGRDGLRGATPHESAQLQKLIQGAALTGNGKGLSPGGVMHLSRKAPRAPLSVLVAPAHSENQLASPQRTAAVIFISDPEQRVEPNREILRRLYRLTPTEAKLAVLLLHGSSLKEAADIHQVAMSTARSQLKSIFRKTEVSSQSQLVRLLSLLPPAPHA
jgi:DNA-binding CsgD family transcriptional regulator/PAS domain-containing protein